MFQDLEGKLVSGIRVKCLKLTMEVIYLINNHLSYCCKIMIKVSVYIPYRCMFSMHLPRLKTCLNTSL